MNPVLPSELRSEDDPEPTVELSSPVGRVRIKLELDSTVEHLKPSLRLKRRRIRSDFEGGVSEVDPTKGSFTVH